MNRSCATRDNPMLVKRLPDEIVEFHQDTPKSIAETYAQYATRCGLTGNVVRRRVMGITGCSKSTYGSMMRSRMEWTKEMRETHQTLPKLPGEGKLKYAARICGNYPAHLSVAQLARIADCNENTLRRYLGTHNLLDEVGKAAGMSQQTIATEAWRLSPRRRSHGRRGDRFLKAMTPDPLQAAG